MLSESLDDIREAKKSCDDFKVLMAGQSCMATKAGGNINVNVDSLNPQCDYNQSMLKAAQSQQNVQILTPTKTENKNPAKKVPKRRSK
ncbi:MAG: hypothetical protein H7326_06455 [Bdellovibrionaceae bacterium]|nr:hypothetical protein [Pseudobdellovibrionaceae bacterium]